MSADKLLELASRCEQATGPDRELDAAIALEACGFYIAAPRYEGDPVAYGYTDKDGIRVEPGHGGMQLVPNFTASLDAAMSLVPEGAGINLERFWVREGPRWSCILSQGLTRAGDAYIQQAASGALVLTAAALRSHAELARQGGDGK
jgi:hypothetical protein